ncbi:carbohydrate-binding protein [Chitinophaga sp. Cy-1792]|uniref:carbohydrate-binding protein n=1 Tax=Chitinophaga sp. Cy-1792 TaxID=2608339 RepID=UPI00141ED410|nr:carbohydrate-binding protein [Chitinophaga sp. Cy-1792]NIG56449.1 carbohydrate-binding protein [Chitinophaga sp. Cy-1792]
MRSILVLFFCLSAFTVCGQSGPNPAPSAKKYETEFMMKNGSILGFAQVNLSLGEIGFKVEVNKMTKDKGTKLEFRIDMPSGRKSKIIGTLDIPYTGDTTYALKLTGNLRHAEGVHDLFLVAKGGSQFSITSFSFIFNY